MQDKDLFGILSHGVRFFTSLFGSLSCNPRKNKTSRSAFLANREVFLYKQCRRCAEPVSWRLQTQHNAHPHRVFSFYLIRFFLSIPRLPLGELGKCYFCIYNKKAMRSLWGDGIVSLSTYFYDFSCVN